MTRTKIEVRRDEASSKQAGQPDKAENRLPQRRPKRRKKHKKITLPESEAPRLGRDFVLTLSSWKREDMTGPS